MIPSSVFTKELYESIPDGWKETRLKYVSIVLPSNVDKKTYEDQTSVKLCNYVDVYYNDSIDNSLNFMISTASDQEIKKFTLKPGDVVLTKDSESPDDIGIPSVVREVVEDLVCGYHLSVLKPKKDVNGIFLFWYIYSKLSSSFFEKRANGITRFAIGMNTVGSLPVIHPSIESQKQIADFLDKETTRIDTLISKKQKQIELLQEKRQAIITQSVTKGLNPDVKMKDSGVEWIGEIPEHWKVRKFSQVISIQEGQVDPSIEPYKSMILIAPNHIESKTGILLNTETAEEQGADSGKYLCRKDDVVYSKIRPNLAKVIISPCDSLCSADMYPMRCDKKILENEFLYWLLLSDSYTRWAVLESMRVAMPKLNRETMSGYRIPVPPLKEQRELISVIKEECSKISVLVEKIKSSIDLLKEYRSSLITHAISGQIDISKYEVSK